jgi:hypothetical protein
LIYGWSCRTTFNNELWILITPFVDFDNAVAVDQAQLAKPVHEEASVGSGCSDHLGKYLLTDFCDDPLLLLANFGRESRPSARNAAPLHVCFGS